MAEWRPLTAEEQIAIREEYLRKKRESMARFRARQKPYMFAKILTEVRERFIADDMPLNTLALIAVVTEGTKAQLAQRAIDYQRRTTAYLDKAYPLEKWVVHRVAIPTAWKGFELWVEYVGTAENAYQKRKWRAAQKATKDLAAMRADTRRRTHPELY